MSLHLKKIHSMTLRFNEQQQGDLSQPCLERESEENTSHVQMHQSMGAPQEVTGPKKVQIKIL